MSIDIAQIERLSILVLFTHVRANIQSISSLMAFGISSKSDENLDIPIREVCKLRLA